MSGHRTARVESLITQKIGTMLMRGEIKDPRVSSLVSISDISVAKDLSIVKIGVSGYMDDSELDAAVTGLNSAAGFIQSQLGKSMHTRLTPRPIFHANRNVKAAFEMSQKIEELRNDVDTPEGGTTLT